MNFYADVFCGNVRFILPFFYGADLKGFPSMFASFPEEGRSVEWYAAQLKTYHKFMCTVMKNVLCKNSVIGMSVRTRAIPPNPTLATLAPFFAATGLSPDAPFPFLVSHVRVRVHIVADGMAAKDISLSLPTTTSMESMVDLVEFIGDFTAVQSKGRVQASHVEARYDPKYVDHWNKPTEEVFFRDTWLIEVLSMTGKLNVTFVFVDVEDMRSVINHLEVVDSMMCLKAEPTVLAKVPSTIVV